MQYVDFKHDGKKVSRFGLGCMRLPKTKDKDGNEIIDEVEAIKLIRHAIDNGVNYIDTAYIYPGSEKVVGMALKDGYRQKVLLATKLPVSKVTCKEDLEKYYKEELEILDVDHIDIYFLHNLYEANWKKALELDAIDFMVDLKNKGKISYIAVSVHGSYDHFITVIDHFDWDLAMIQYNYYDKYNQAGMKGLHYASSKGIPVVSMESLHGGMLANDVPKEVEDAFKGWNKELTNAHRAFMWLYNQPEVTVVLSGSSSIEQLDESLAIFNEAKSNILTDVEVELYDDARKVWESFVNIQCTGCEYCMPCPFGVDIPGVFHLWNEFAKTPAQKWLYDMTLTQSNKDATLCVSCGKCVRVCPQKLEIPKMLNEAHQALKK